MKVIVDLEFDLIEDFLYFEKVHVHGNKKWNMENRQSRDIYIQIHAISRDTRPNQHLKYRNLIYTF